MRHLRLVLFLTIPLALAGCANDPPTADFTLNPNPTAGQTVTFDGSTSTGGRDANDQPIGVRQWDWDLDGNGTYERTTYGPTVSHTYSGTRTIETSLRVTSWDGRQAQTARTVVTSESQTASVLSAGTPANGTACGPVPSSTVLSGPPPTAPGPAMTAELQANGVPNATVTVTTPAPATAADAAAFQADPSVDRPSLTPYNLLSPDPTNPLPVATVKYGPSTLSPFPGVLQAPGQPGVFKEDAQDPIWQAHIMSALKHAIAGGAPLAGVALQPVSTNAQRNASAPEVYVAASDLSAARPAQLLPTIAVQLQFQLDLPAQYSNATVAATDLAGGQRMVVITIERDPASYPSDNLADLVAFADAEQSKLNDPMTGGNVGIVAVRSCVPVSGNPSGAPILTHAADSSWGQKFEWAAPQVRAFYDQSVANASTP